MEKIYLGHNQAGEMVELDFNKEEIKFILLVGQSNSGKSIFHLNLYKEIMNKYSSAAIGFVFLDMTKIDFNTWPSEYLIKPVITDPHQAIELLHELVGFKTNKKIIIHIEECDMIYIDRQRVEAALEKLKQQEGVYVVYSTSRLDKGYLKDWLIKFIDLRVVFAVATQGDSNFLLGNSAADNFKNNWERILAFNGWQIHCQPFTEHEVELLEKVLDKSSENKL